MPFLTQTYFKIRHSLYKFVYKKVHDEKNVILKHEKINMTNIMDRRIIFAFIIFIVVLLLFRNLENRTKPQQRTQVVNSEIARFERLGSEPPSNVPFYSKFEIDGVSRTVADYTSVPYEIAIKLKQTENPKNYIIDRKFTYLGKGGNAELPENISAIDIKLAAAMAGKSEAEIAEIWSKLTTEEIGRMIEKTKETARSISQELIDKKLTDAQIKTQYDNEEAYIKSLPIGFDCQNVRDDCDKWRENNDCLINPEFMLSNCPKSCGTCLMTPEQKARLAEIYGARSPPNCVYHQGYTVASYGQMSE